MNEKTARTSPEQTIPGGKEVRMERAPSSWTSMPRDEVYERRIFELECYIERLEYLLMMTECERNEYKRKACA